MERKSDINVCNKCQKEAFQKCGGCQSVFYCSKEHQKLDWKQHKRHCQSFMVAIDPILGRHLVATRDIKPNEIILKEKPLIYGPSQNTVPVCLGCCQEIDEKNYRLCSKCGWPICSEQCEKSSCHIPECHYTCTNAEKVRIKDVGTISIFYQCVMALRCLYQKEHNQEVWKKLDILQSHCEERKKTQRYNIEKVNVTQFIRNFLKMENDFSEEEIMRVCGIITVNAHEVPLSEPSYIAIYEKTSMFENDCRSNCTKTFTNSGDILITSGINIKKGDHLSICYADPLWSTTNRRKFLYETKFFWCSCKRCSDPTEFGTYFSTVRCQNGQCRGYLLPKTFLSSEEEIKEWHCKKCEYSVSSFLVHTMLEKIETDIASIDKDDVTAIKKFICKLEKILPPYNNFLTDLKLELGQLIGQKTRKGLSDVSNSDLELKRKLCQELADLTKILVPSEKRVRGLVLFELHASLAEVARRKSINIPNIEEVNSFLKESHTNLTECIQLLKFEPDVLPEGKVYKQALKNLSDLDQLLRRQNLK